MTSAESSLPRRADEGGRHGRHRRGGRRRGEQLMVPKAEFQSYYGRPVIKPPSWEARDIAGYFFLGGLAGAAPCSPPVHTSPGGRARRRR